MQMMLGRGKAALGARGAWLCFAIFASAASSLAFPHQALAACGGSSRPAGVHAAGSGSAGVHVASTTVTRSSGASGGGGTLGCAGGSVAAALHGLPVASSGRVVQPGAHAAHAETHARTATTRTANVNGRVHAFGRSHRA
jgi:hypothetical protein